ASMVLWVQEANRLREGLPPEVQATLLRHEKAGTTSSDEYNKAVRVFYDRHVCRVNPWPPEVQRTFDALAEDSTVYMTMNGPSEFHVIGTLKTWSIIDRLDRIEVPVLLISGKYDEATPATVQPFKDHIKDVRWEIFEHSSHMPHVEETDRYLQVVSKFLDAYDRKKWTSLNSKKRKGSTHASNDLADRSRGTRRLDRLERPGRIALASGQRTAPRRNHATPVRRSGRHARSADQLHAAVLATLSEHV